MEFGIKLPNFSMLKGREPLIAMAKAAEQLGYDAVWTADHLVIPEKIAPANVLSPTGEWRRADPFTTCDALIALAVAAGCTERVKLGTGVLVLPYRNPLLTAKMLSSLDMLSNGRVILGAGIGWMKEEFEALHAPDFHRRGQVTDEWIRIFRLCWSEELASYQGRHYSFDPLHFNPRPARPIPILIGGNSPAALKRAGQIGDGWVGTQVPVEDIGPAIAEIRSHASAAGRDPASLTFTMAYYLEVTDEEREQGLDLTGQPHMPTAGLDLIGTPEQIAARLRQLERLGISHVEIRIQAMRDLNAPSLDRTLSMMEAFAKRVRPLL